MSAADAYKETPRVVAEIVTVVLVELVLKPISLDPAAIRSVNLTHDPEE